MPQPEVAEIKTQVSHAIQLRLCSSAVKAKPGKKIKLITKSWFWCVILPFIICCCYFGLIASDRYVGEAKVIVKQADNNSTADFGIALLGAAMSSGKQDAQLVRQFILSLDMLHQLDKSLSFKRPLPE